jgi:hypothetical protein
MLKLLIKPRHSKIVSEERLMKWGRKEKHLQRTLQTLVFWTVSFFALGESLKKKKRSLTKCRSPFVIRKGTKLLSRPP